MDFWSPLSSPGLCNTEDPYHHQSAGDHFTHERYKMDIMPPTDSLFLQNTHTDPAWINGMEELQHIKCEPEMEWEEQTSGITPQSESTQRSEASIAPPTTTSTTATARKGRVKKSRASSWASTSTTTTTSLPRPGDVGREKNRIAASKCRRKKKVEEKQLEERRRLLSVQNAILADSAAELRSEVLNLKNEILRHGTCDFAPIQHYIETAASQFGQ